MRAGRAASLVLGLAVAGVGELRAQLLSANGAQNLAFGNVLPGVTTTVQPTDPARGARFDITGPSLAQVEVTFTLPAVLSAGGGATMPISFGPTSAGYTSSGSNGAQTAFDPRTPFRASLSLLGRGWVYLGGALSPPGAQSAGSYTAAVGMTVALVGL